MSTPLAAAAGCALLVAATAFADNPAVRPLLDFTTPADAARFAPVDDVVMGGVSRSRLRHDPAGHAVFEGEVSLAQGGGFASVRTAPGDLGAPGATALLLEVRGDGRRYKLNLRTDDAFDGVNYQAAFVPPTGEWTSVRLPLAAFRPTLRGRDVQAPPLDPGRIRRVGFMIGERQAGPFALAIRQLVAE